MNLVRRIVPALILSSVAILCLRGMVSASRPSAQPSPTLNAVLWMQTSGEYAACCLQTYRFAAEHIERDLEEWTGRQAIEDLPPTAVIMDLDETVLDNSTYQSYLIDTCQQHSSELFNRFVSEHAESIGLVPGAKQFIDRMESMGLTVVYVTNRAEAIRDGTIATLRHRQLNTENLAEGPDTRLLMKMEESSKAARFRVARSKYRVVAMVGDQMGDFAGEPDGDAEHRTRLTWVADRQQEWGTRWFILPNPVYGEWLQTLRPEAARHLRRHVD